MDSAKNEYQPLRAVDPGAAVEGATAGPQPGHFGVPPFVGTERRAPERDARDYREEERQRAEEWGPPRPDLDRRTLLLAGVGLAVALAAAVYVFGLGLTPDRYVFVLLVPALIMRRGRRYALDFIPFAGLLVLYAQFRGIAHLLRPDPHYLPQLNVDRFLFGAVPSVELQHWLWTGAQHWYDHLTLDILRLHFIVPPLLAFMLWVKRRSLFIRFAATMITLSFAGAITFFVFPAAPPWAAGEDGLLPNLIRIPHNPAPGPTHSGIAGISISRLIDPNPYAAIPSLHAGYAFLSFLFVATLVWRTRWRWWGIGLAALYPLAESWAVVYTGNHYVIDIVLGYLYAVASLAAVGYVWRRLRLPE
jgi:membrane-associated phospholipid phosphatase